MGSGGGNMDWNPMHSSLGAGLNQVTKAITGGHVDLDPAKGALNTGVGLPWGPGSHGWNIDQSALNTGKGLPWGPAGEKDPLSNAALGNPNAPLTADGKDKKTGEQYYGNPEAPPGAEQGLPTVAPPPPSTPVQKPSKFIRASAFDMSKQNKLEDQLRSALNKSLPKNVEFTFFGENSPYKRG